MRNFLNSRFLCVCASVIVLGAFVLIGSDAPAAWEELPAPPIMITPGTIVFSDDTWSLFLTCTPFLVPDNDNGIYLGHAANSYEFKTWLIYDTTAETYSNLAAPASSLGSYSICMTADAEGAYVDDRVYINTDFEGRIAEYDVVGNTWSWSPLTVDYYHAMPSMAADENHELLYWHEQETGVSRFDPEIGLSSLESHAIYYEDLSSSGLSVQDNRAYLAGGFDFPYFSKGTPVYGESSSLARIFDYIEVESSPIRSLPDPATMMGSGWGGDGLHFVGGNMTGLMLPWLPGFMDRSFAQDEIYHFVYNPESDDWANYWNDLPPDCLPLSVVEQGGWLYGLFSCLLPNPHFPRLYRTRIDNLTWPPPTTTTTTATTTTTTQPPTDDDTVDDDTVDDDTVDDDTTDDDTTDDDAQDDDTTDDDSLGDDVNADAGDDSGGDDDGCGI